jgi:Uma2 family endonuclease
MSTVASPEQATDDPFRYGWRYVWQKDARGMPVQVQVPLTLADVLHPQEEDRIVQNDLHDRDCVYLREVLREASARLPASIVFHDMRIDWGVEGVSPLGPDVIVFQGPQRPWVPGQGTFHVADLGARPVLVVEVTSPTTRDLDLDEKVLLYFRAGVPFYAIVDYRTDTDPPSIGILGYQATANGYVQAPLSAEGRLWLPEVRLWLAAEDGRAVCYDEQGNRVPDYAEIKKTAKEALDRAEEAHLLTEEAVQARKDAEAKAADQERLRKDAEAKARDAESRAADLARSLQDLQAELQRLRGAAPLA